MNPMLEAFIGESRDLLETASKCFLALEKSPNDQEIFNELFRAVHTIKGASGIFDIVPFTKVVHAAEDILDQVKVGKITLNPDHIDLLLDCLDQVGMWLDDLEQTETLSANAAEISGTLTQQLRALLGESGGGAENSAETSPQADSATTTDNEPTSVATGEVESNEPSELPLWWDEMSVEEALNIFDQFHERGVTDVHWVTYSAPDDCYFTGQDPLAEMRSLPELAWFGVAAINAWPDSPADFDPFKHNLQFHGISTAPREAIFDHFRHVPEYISVGTVVVTDLVRVEGEPGEPENYSHFVSDAQGLINQDNWQGVGDLADSILSYANPEHRQSRALAWIKRLAGMLPLDVARLQALLRDVDSNIELPTTTPVTSAVTSPKVADSSSGSEPAIPQASGNDERAVAVELIDAQLAALTLPIDSSIWSGRATSIASILKRVVHYIGLDSPADFDIDQALEHAKDSNDAGALHDLLTDVDKQLREDTSAGATKPSDTAATPESTNTSAPDISVTPAAAQSRASEEPTAEPDTTAKKSQSKVLRVDQSRIDALMDLVGELVVAKNALPFLARRAENDYQCRDLSREIRCQYAIINRLAEDMQNAVMQVRMVPVSAVFQRFPRLVRDLSRKLGKNISLNLIGEDTEADKTVVEDLADPLIHIVRNSIDHGIESPETRASLGKPETATIILKATQLDDQVLIEIQDDGKGINPQVIKDKALEKGVIDEETYGTISDKEALHLIFAPGFSTAEAISDLSGRGVGMDVVRSTIENAGGSVSVESELGVGTQITLALPLSMAVSQVMMIRCDDQSYGVSYDSIVETVRISKDAVSRIKSQQTIVLRDRIIPLFYLRDLLSLPPRPDGLDEYGQAVLIVEIEGEETGIVVDDFQEGTDLILKPLEGIMAQCPYYSGTALLGDGRVLMVINLKELTACQ